MGFDPNGNLTSLQAGPGLQAFSWHPRDLLQRLRGPSTSDCFAYDALGRHVEKRVIRQQDEDGDATPDPTEELHPQVIRYLYDG